MKGISFPPLHRRTTKTAIPKTPSLVHQVLLSMPQRRPTPFARHPLSIPRLRSPGKPRLRCLRLSSPRPKTEATAWKAMAVIDGFWEGTKCLVSLIDTSQTTNCPVAQCNLLQPLVDKACQAYIKWQVFQVRDSGAVNKFKRCKELASLLHADRSINETQGCTYCFEVRGRYAPYNTITHSARPRSGCSCA